MGENYERMTISFTEADKDIIKYLDKLKKSNKASEFVRTAIREKMKRDEGVKEDSLENKIRRIVEDVLSKHQSPSPQAPKQKNDSELDSAVIKAVDLFDF